MNIIDDLRAVQARMERARVKVDEAIAELAGVETIVKEKAKLFPELGEKEKQVARLLGEGLSTQDIAQRLGTSKKTVENQRDVIRRKFGVGSSHELVRMIKEGLI